MSSTGAAMPIAKYDAMIFAIAECHQYDEVKDLHDKARALEVYARQAKNTEAERKASDIRLRAERRAGELLKELARAETPNPNGIGGKSGKVVASNDATQQSPYASALERTGTSRQTAARYQALANVPAPVFEDALRDPHRKPSTTRLINEARDPAPKMRPDSLWLWGRVRDFERDGFDSKNHAELFEAMTETMQADMRRIVPWLADFFNELAEVVKK